MRAILTWLLFILLSEICLGGVYCVGPVATGNGSGADWNNVKGWNASPARGDSWYLAGGTYPGLTFSVAASGTNAIAILKATQAYHVTDTGWTAAMSTQAVFTSEVQLLKGNYIFDGVTPQGTNWDTNPADYGFRFKDGVFNGSYYADIQAGAPQGSGLATSNYVVAHVAGKGHVGDPGSSAFNFFLLGQGVNLEVDNVTVSNCLMDNWQNDVVLGTGNAPARNWLVQGCVMQNTPYYSDAHSECISENNGYAVNTVIRNNLFKNSTGTCIIVPALMYKSSNWYIYGNVFKNCSSGGNGIIGTGSSGVSATGIYIYNNTFDGCTGGWLNNLDASSGSVLTGSATNNLFYNSSAGGPPANFGTVDYSAYFSCSGNNGDAHGQTGSGNPFINDAGDNYLLKTNSAPGATLGAAYAVDALGHTRSTWTRGALEYQVIAAATNQPIAGTNVIVYDTNVLWAQVWQPQQSPDLRAWSNFEQPFTNIAPNPPRNFLRTVNVTNWPVATNIIIETNPPVTVQSVVKPILPPS